MTLEPISTLNSWTCELRPWSKIENEIRLQRTAPEIEIDVFRHGETVRNASGQISGSTEVALTARGLQQAVLAGSELSGTYQVAFQSSLSRSRETLENALASTRCNVGAIHTDARLSERSMGNLEGTLSRPLPAYDEGDLTWAPPGGETYFSVAQRILCFLLDLSQRARAHPEPVRVLVCTHVGPMRVLFGILDQLESAADVLTSQFGNARVHQRLLQQIHFPPFIDRQTIPLQ